MRKTFGLALLFWILLTLIGLANQALNPPMPTPTPPMFHTDYRTIQPERVSSTTTTVEPSQLEEMWNGAVNFFAAFGRWEVDTLSQAMNGAAKHVQALIGLLLALREIFMVSGLFMLSAVRRGLEKIGG